MEISGTDFADFNPSRHVDEFVTALGQLRNDETCVSVGIKDEDFYMLEHDTQTNGVKNLKLSTDGLNLKELKDGYTVEIQGYIRKVMHGKELSPDFLLFPDDIKIIDKSIVKSFKGIDFAKTDFIKRFLMDLRESSYGCAIEYELTQGFEYRPPKIQENVKILGNLYLLRHPMGFKIEKKQVEKDTEKIFSRLRSKYEIIEVGDKLLFKKVKRGLFADFKVVGCYECD